MTRWPCVSFADICDEIYDGPHATPEKLDHGPYFLSISSLVNGRVDLSQSLHVSELDFKKWTRRIVPQEDDLVFSYETRLGDAALIPKGLRCCLGRRMALIRPYADRVDPRFLLYYFLSPGLQNQIREFTICGSTVERLALADIRKFRMPLPPLAEQKAIAAVLGALDDKIELNRRMNATLESMARALFQSWFVDFDPVRAKLDGRQPTGINTDTAALFPDSFQDSELGRIPDGWEATTLGNVCRVYGGEIKTGPFGTSLNAREYQHTGTPAIAVRDIRNGYIEIDGRTPMLSNSTVERLAIYKVQEGDILFGRKGAVERSSYIGGVESGWLMGSDCIRLRLPMDLSPIIWSHGFRTPAMIAWIQQNATGTTMASLNQGILERIPLVIPPRALLSKLSPVFLTIQSKLEANRRESRTLATLRDTLLPKLLSGELSVAAATHAMEHA